MQKMLKFPWVMRINLQIQKKLFFSHFLAVILVSGSIGTYFYLSAKDTYRQNVEKHIKDADGALYQAKNKRRNRVVVFESNE